MKWKPIIMTAAALAVTGIGYAGYRYYKREKDLLGEYEVKPIAFSIGNLTADNVVINFTLRLTNKSNIEAVMKEISSDIYLNDVFLGYVVNDTPANIPAKGTADIRMHVSFNPKLILKNILDLVLLSAQLKDVKYRLKGYVKLQSGFVPVDVPFEDSGKLSDFF